MRIVPNAQINGPQVGLSWTPEQLSLATATAKNLGNTSYWVCPAKNAVYALYLYSPYAFPNSEYPYQLRVWTYAPSASFYADSQQFLGGIAIDGTISTTELNQSWKGTLISVNQIVWNDGSMWYRTQPPPMRGTNPYGAGTVYQQAVNDSAYFNNIYNRAYPNLYKSIPW